MPYPKHDAVSPQQESEEVWRIIDILGNTIDGEDVTFGIVMSALATLLGNTIATAADDEVALWREIKNSQRLLEHSARTIFEMMKQDGRKG